MKGLYQDETLVWVDIYLVHGFVEIKLFIANDILILGRSYMVRRKNAPMNGFGF